MKRGRNPFRFTPTEEKVNKVIESGKYTAQDVLDVLGWHSSDRYKNRMIATIVGTVIQKRRAMLTDPRAKSHAPTIARTARGHSLDKFIG